ncbi:MAG: hypothetical protein A0129_15050 [Limnobacter sp. CACIAM 66H1]|uniref:glycosyltransferase n=1 Tax=Limnobacter sp. CACIAM 66H1 TaxID=1813033 RepID=UPI0007A827DC|nr:glycosyltransferase [Limnobacter sp. CACIAM 66H1]KYP10052.1 MAG: hypothetical protein A0129_15050 [Limnobacter sp. CACIAM 66H1]
MSDFRLLSKSEYNIIEARIAVCLCAFNGGKYIHEQIESIITADCFSEEDILLIHDDGSQDNTVDIVRRFCNPQIVLIRSAERLGPCKAFERAIAYVSARYYFFSDQDDVWDSTKILSFLQKFEGGAEIVVGNGLFVDEKLNPLGKSILDIVPPRECYILNLIRPSYVGASLAINRQVRDLMLPFPLPVYMHDMWCGIFVTLGFRLAVIKSNTFYYRRHSEVFTKSRNPIHSKLFWRFRFILATFFAGWRIVFKVLK